MKTIYTSTKTHIRKMFCEHCRCNKITKHNIRYARAIYDNKNKEFNVTFSRECIECKERNPDTDFDFMDIISADSWNALVLRPDIV